MTFSTQWVSLRRHCILLCRADKLIGGLGGERVRWQSTVEQLSLDLVNVVGDVVVAAGSIAYAGGILRSVHSCLGLVVSTVVGMG